MGKERMEEHVRPCAFNDLEKSYKTWTKYVLSDFFANVQKVGGSVGGERECGGCNASAFLKGLYFYKSWSKQEQS